MDAELKKKLEQIIKLLEIMAFGGGLEECPHQNVIDRSVMGQEPMTVFYCNDCRQVIYRKADQAV